MCFYWLSLNSSWSHLCTYFWKSVIDTVPMSFWRMWLLENHLTNPKCTRKISPNSPLCNRNKSTCTFLLQDGVNHDLAIITEWLKANKLSLNIKKTHYMCFSSKKQSKAWYIIKNWWWYSCWSYFIKILGIIIDDQLNWKDHMSFVCRKVARGLIVIIKARKNLRNESLKSLYYSFIYPYLIYCNQVWGSAYKTNITPLFILQKRSLRIITGVHPRSPSEPLFCQLKFLNF